MLSQRNLSNASKPRIRNGHLERAHLEYNNSVWAPYKRCDIEKLEKVQKTSNKIGPSYQKTVTGFKKDAIS